jgi:hypothetical protein
MRAQSAVTTTRTAEPQLSKLSVNHARNCKICHHPKRQAIESMFMESGSPDGIAEYFGLHDRQNVYRHATAAGLYKLRRRAEVRNQERLMEEAGCIKLSSRAVMAAAQSFLQYAATKDAAEVLAVAQASALKTIRTQNKKPRNSSTWSQSTPQQPIPSHSRPHSRDRLTPEFSAT